MTRFSMDAPPAAGHEIILGPKVTSRSTSSDDRMTADTPFNSSSKSDDEDDDELNLIIHRELSPESNSSTCDTPSGTDSDFGCDSDTLSLLKKGTPAPVPLRRSLGPMKAQFIFIELPFGLAIDPPKNATPPSAPLRRSLNPKEAQFFFTELELTALPDSVTTRKAMRQSRCNNSSCDRVSPRDSRPQTSLTSAPKRGRTRGRQLLTPPQSSHTSPARIIKTRSTSLIRKVSIGFTSSISLTLSRDMGRRNMGDTLIMESSTASQPSQRSGRTADEEAHYLINNSGFNISYRERVEKAYPKCKPVQLEPAMPRLGKRKSEKLFDKHCTDFDIHEDDTATSPKKPRHGDSGMLDGG